MYKSQIRAQYNKKVKVRELKKGDLVIKRVDVLKSLTKWAANWEGPFVVVEILRGGAYHLAEINGSLLP